jgi:hypothetical protein
MVSHEIVEYAYLLTVSGVAMAPNISENAEVMNMSQKLNLQPRLL